MYKRFIVTINIFIIIIDINVIIVNVVYINHYQYYHCYLYRSHYHHPLTSSAKCSESLCFMGKILQTINKSYGQCPLLRPSLQRLVSLVLATGTMVTMEGVLYTSLFGPNEMASTNGKTAKFLRVYFGSQKCEAKDPNQVEDVL